MRWVTKSLYWLGQRKFQLSCLDIGFVTWSRACTNTSMHYLWNKYLFCSRRGQWWPTQVSQVDMWRMYFVPTYVQTPHKAYRVTWPSQPLPLRPLSSHLLCSSLRGLILSLEHSRLLLALNPLQNTALSPTVLGTPTFSWLVPSDSA